MSKPTKDQLLNFELNHKHAGNGLYMCEDIDDEYCRCTEMTAVSAFGSRAFLTAKDRLSVSQTFKKGEKTKEDVRVPDALVEPLKTLRAEMKSGKLASFHTHIMSGSKASALRKELLR